MSESGTEASGSSFSSSVGASSASSDNTDTRALNSLQEGDGEDGDSLGFEANKSIQEGLFATFYTLTKNKALDTSLRIATIRVVFEFLQFFRIVFNTTFPWSIQKDLWILRAIEWVLIRAVVDVQGYGTYITVFYVLVGLIFATMGLTVWVAVVLKGSEPTNPWMARLVSLLQLLALVLFGFAWPVVMDFMVFLWDCKWTDTAHASHIYFTDQSCMAMPHLVHMVCAGITTILLAGMVLLMGISSCDANPLTRNLLSSSDEVTSTKMLILKIIFVIVATMLDQLSSAQAGVMAVCMFGVVYYLADGVPFYNKTVNIVWGGLWLGILDVTVILLVMQTTSAQQADPITYHDTMTKVMLYTIFPAMALGALLMWLRLRQITRLAKSLHNTFNVRKAAVLANATDDYARTSGCVVALMGDLRAVYRFRDARQVMIVCREMRHWDEDGQPDAEAIEFGEWLIKCGMARLPNNPSLLVMHACFTIEAKKDGQAARSQLQVAQKANPGMLDNYKIFVAQQLAKQLKRDSGDGLDLLSFVEFQRNYMACVRSHKAALMAQRAFFNSLLKDTISFRDLQAKVLAMEAAEQCATAVYRRVMERYPGNGKIMKVYGRFLEFVRSEPGAAGKFYEAALKEGTSDSLLALTAGEESAAGLSGAGAIDEKVDGLVVINAQGTILMVNAATLGLFGYQKGELEGKNVSILMLQPLSGRHDSFLQRYVESGKPHIINKTRAVVALHKDRHLFPLSLYVTRLSGVGSDMLFMGVLRNEPAAGTSDNQIVKFWTTPAGMILCADSSMTDALGIQPGELVGRSFCNLCADVEAVNTYISQIAHTAEQTDASGTVQATPTFNTKMLHAFMPPVDVELWIQFGGHTEAGSDFRCLIVHARMLTEAAAVMVVGHNGHIQHATAKLANLLGHPVAKLVKMELNALIPQPICQMHGAWFKAPQSRMPSTSCRAGGVVHLLAANSTKIPVTLKMITKEETSTGLTHVVQVTKATEQQRLDQQRMVLSVNHKGIILSVNPGAPKSLFGFEAQQLAGQPLSSIIDVFSDWKAGCGEELSLLELLVGQLMAAPADQGAQHPAGTPSWGCESWRVGVHRPSAAQHGDKEASGTTMGSSLLHVLQPNKAVPACMKLASVASDEGDLLADSAAADTTAIIEVSLHRSDALVTVFELDSGLSIGRADDAAGLIFGVDAKQLMHKSFAKLVGLSGVTRFEDLLSKHGAKKGAMRTTGAASRAGEIRCITATHLGDGQPLNIRMQAMSYEQSGRRRHVVHVQLVSPVSAAMNKLLAMKEGKDVAAPAVLEPPDMMGACAQQPGSRHSQGSSSHGSDQAGLTAEPSGMEQPALSHGKSAQIREWVRQASHLEAPDDDSISEAPWFKGQHQQQQGLPAGHHTMLEADAQVALQVRLPARGSKGLKPEKAGSLDDGPYSRRAGVDTPRYPLNNAAADTADPADDAASSFGASMADGMSDAGSAMESAAEGIAREEDLAVDTRRAKRLKKLTRMLSSGIAQAATNSWRRETLYLLAVILIAHIACFAVISTQLDARHANAVSVNTIAMSMTAVSQGVLRLNLLHKCALPGSSSLFFCDANAVQEHGSRLALNSNNFRRYHHDLFLGGDGLQPFRDSRLINYWTYQGLPETIYYQQLEDGSPGYLNSTRTLWEMGNNFMDALDATYFHRNIWLSDSDKQPDWQYAFINGPGSIFTGYAWSLDTFVDYTWQDLTKLSTVMIILLVVEVVIVQTSCMAYEFYLLQRCNVANMRLFSVFLALPSATVRLMVKRPLLVDDSINDDADDDELELMEGPSAAGKTTATATDGDAVVPQEKKKSVRLAADDDDTEKPGVSKQGKGSMNLKGKGGLLAAKATKKAAGGFVAMSKKLQTTLFGWLNPRFKRNGKKLLPSTHILWRFMVPLLLWLSMVMVIYGVSYINMQGLQGPLASLDLSSHVMYRLSHARLAANLLAFAPDSAARGAARTNLKLELDLLRREYTNLLYGGAMMLQANVSFDPVAPAAVFTDPAVADIFFKTTACLRADPLTCLTPDDVNYQITHSGLNAQIMRYIEETTTFSNLPDSLATANATSYGFVFKVTARDTYDGLQTAANLFVAGTLQK